VKRVHRRRRRAARATGTEAGATRVYR